MKKKMYSKFVKAVLVVSVCMGLLTQIASAQVFQEYNDPTLTSTDETYVVEDAVTEDSVQEERMVDEVETKSIEKQVSLLDDLSKDQESFGKEKSNEYTFDFMFPTVYAFHNPGRLSVSLNLNSEDEPTGYIFALDTLTCRVQRYSPIDIENPNVSGTSGGWGGTKSMNAPEGIAVSLDGSVFVADTGNNRILKFDNSGKLQTSWASNGILSSDFNKPVDIAIEPSSKNSIAVVDAGNRRVVFFDANGKKKGQRFFTYNNTQLNNSATPKAVCYKGTSLFSAWDTPLGVYIANGDAAARPLTGGTHQNDKLEIVDIAGDIRYGSLTDGSLFVALKWTTKEKTPKSGYFIRWVASNGDTRSEFTLPNALGTINSIEIVKLPHVSGSQFEGYLYVLEKETGLFDGVPCGQGRKFKISFPTHGTNKITEICSFGGDSNVAGKFSVPRDVVAGKDGSIYVADTRNHRIQKLAKDGSCVWTLGSKGTADSKFNYPSGIALSPDNTKVYVADTSNNRISAFHANTHTFLWKTSGPLAGGTAAGQFKRPYNLAVDAAGRIYVADYQNSRIQCLDPNTGKTLWMWGQQGTTDGKLNLPFAIAFDASGKTYIGDAGTPARVQRFSVVTNKTGGKLVWEKTALKGQNPICGLCILPGGGIVISDQVTNNVLEYTKNGTLTNTIGVGYYGLGRKQFALPFGLDTDASGKYLYVADSLNHRIQRLSRVP